MIKKQKKTDLSKELKNNRRLFKIVAVFFSLTIWFYVLNSEPYELDKDVPLRFLTPNGLAVANLTPPVVTVKLKGARAFMQNLFASDEKIYLNLQDPKYSGLTDFEVPINASDIPVPFGVEVLEINPQLISVRLEREISKEVPVRLQLTGELPAELRLIKQELSPQKIMISGPVEVMRRISSLRTTPVSQSGLEGDGEMRLGLNDLDPRVSLTEPPASGFLFQYSVKARTANLTLKNVKIRFLASKQNFESRQKEVAVDILAPEGRSLRESEVQVIADIPEDAKGVTTIKLRAQLPDGVHLLQIHPETINVTVK